MLFRYALLLSVVSTLVASTPIDAREPAPQGLSVMSFNMWHKDRPNELRIMAQSMRSDLTQLPDFILCQEVVFKRDEGEPNTAAVLASELGGYYARGTKRTSDREGIAIISRYPFAYYDALHLKAQTSRLLLGFNRVSVMGEFIVPRVGRVRVVDVHLTNWGFEHHIRRKQIAETLAWIDARQRKAPAAVTFLGGDFNAKVHWDEMEQVTALLPSGLQFRDFNTKTPSKGSPGNPSIRIDLIFVATTQLAPALRTEKLFWKDGLRDGDDRFYLSDHLCLLQEYAVIPKPDAPVLASVPIAAAER